MSKIAFVLSGGGSLGALQVGMVHALYERGIVPDLIIGTSVGALNGTYLAAHDKTLATVNRLYDLWDDLDRNDIFPISLRRAINALCGRSQSFVDPSKLEEFVRDNANVDEIQNTATELHLVATDLLTGKEELMSSGDIVQAILASTALPGVFPPVRRNGKVLIDGGVSNNTPISHARRFEATQTYVLSTGAPTCAMPDEQQNAIDILIRAASLLVDRRLRDEYEAYRAGLADDDEPSLFMLPSPCDHEVDDLKFGETKKLFNRGRADAVAYLDDNNCGCG